MAEYHPARSLITGSAGRGKIDVIATNSDGRPRAPGSFYSSSLGDGAS